MKPGVEQVAAELARRLREEIYPELTGFRANVAGMGAELMTMIAEQWDGAAANLVSENRELRDILRRGGEVLADESLAAAGAGADDDLRISALTAENDRLRAALTALHARVEETEGPAARALDAAIWAALRRSVDVRRVGSANF